VVVEDTFECVSFGPPSSEPTVEEPPSSPNTEALGWMLDDTWGSSLSIEGGESREKFPDDAKRDSTSPMSKLGNPSSIMVY
jgi:hypothetical protein